ncbi:MAG: type II toxin-antitoxin system HicA family toxin, partial [Terriglobia bacterium]
MPKLRRLSGRQACAILERNGFVKGRQRGSHIVMQRRIGED